MLGYYDPEGKLSFHVFTAALATAALLALPTGLLPKWLRTPIQFAIGILVILVCLVDVYCQIYLLNAITPQIFITVFLSNISESAEFLSTYININVLTKWRIALLLLLFVLFIVSHVPLSIKKHQLSQKFRYVSICVMWCCMSLALAVEAYPTWHFAQFFSPQCDAFHTESLIFRHYNEEVSTPIHRIIQSWYATRQSGKLLTYIEQSTINAVVDSCSHLSPHIVLIIGESYNKHHSSLYGYKLPTTPLQQKRHDNGELFVFEDVVTPWNITSNVFLNMFSTWNNGCNDYIGHYPLFPALFRKAGYEVTFFSNQYVTKGFRKTSTNQAGYFFLTSRTACEEMFDYRNSKAHGIDMRLVGEFADYKDHRDHTSPTLDIIHLIGQHFDYKSRYPREENFFSTRDLGRADLNDEARSIVMHYDNATHYNDMVVDKILSLYESEETIVIYVADHGEEVYDGMNVFGRLFQVPTWIQAHQEFEVPMWIWCSPSYRERHADVVDRICQSAKKPLLTDDIPQLLFSVAGVHCQWRDDSHNILSENYQSPKRIIAGEIDYDELKAKSSE